MEFFETTIFTKQITSLISDEEYKNIQNYLVLNPHAGAIIKHSGGLRKLRWKLEKKGKGKRGGIRLIYYWYLPQALYCMLLVYSKQEKDDLSKKEVDILRRVVKEAFG